jgi:hypothetical protein
MRQSKIIMWLKELAHFWKDLVLLVLGIYMALWMENAVQGWENDNRQRDYMYRLSIDLIADEKLIKELLPILEKKINRLQEAILFLQKPDLDPSNPDVQAKAVTIANTVTTYSFFSPQDFTFLSMRESGDFKLLSEDEIKTELLQINNQYQFTKILQSNYMQGLDDEFIPLWIRSADMISGNIIHPEVIQQPIFKNMVGFAYNETYQRKSHLDKTLKQIRALRIKLELGAKRH